MSDNLGTKLHFWQAEVTMKMLGNLGLNCVSLGAGRAAIGRVGSFCRLWILVCT